MPLQLPEHNVPHRQPRATRIDANSVLFRRVVPALLVLLLVALIVLIGAVVAVVLGIFPGA
jgi:hypothetical protein